MAMGSLVSPIVANLFMDELERRAIDTAPEECKPNYWKRYVDDTKKGQVKKLTDHLTR